MRVKNSCGITTTAVSVKMRGILKVLKLAKDGSQLLLKYNDNIFFILQFIRFVEWDTCHSFQTQTLFHVSCDSTTRCRKGVSHLLCELGTQGKSRNLRVSSKNYY